MADLKELLNKIEETEQSFKESKKEYEKAVSEIKEIEHTIKQSGEIIDECKKELDSGDAMKGKIIAEIDEEFEKEKTQIKTRFEDKKKEIKEQFKKETIKKEKEINHTYDKLKQENENRVKKIEEEVWEKENVYRKSLEESRELENRIIESEKEENRIKLLLPIIREEYAGVKDNYEYLADERNPQGATTGDAIEKYSTMSDKSIIEIANKMKNGIYYSSPDESDGLPVLEIFMNTLNVIGMVFKKTFEVIWTILKALFAPFSKIRSGKMKVLYGIIVIGSLGLFIFFVVGRVIGVLLNVLLIIIGLILLVFVGMIIYNFLKLGNKKIRRELNIGYYTVGYYFNHREEEILDRLAIQRYHELKMNRPSELENIIRNEFGFLEIEKNRLLENLANQEVGMKNAKQKLSQERLNYENTKAELETELKNELAKTKAELDELETDSLTTAKMKFDTESEQNENNKKNKLKNLDIKIKRKNEENENKIKEKEREIISYEKRKESLEKEVQKTKERILREEKENKDYIGEIKNADINLIGERGIHDKIPTRFFFGVERDEQEIEIEHQLHFVYRESMVKNENKPMFILFKEGKEESNKVIKKYYQAINNMMIQFLSETYARAFQFVLFDNELDKNRIKGFMPMVSDKFDALINEGIIEIKGDHLEKVLSDLKAKREKELNGKSPDKVNEMNQSQDKMVRWIILFIRIYGEKGKTFDMKNLNREFGGLASSQGILPIFFMKEEVYESNKEDIALFLENEEIYDVYELDLNEKEEFLVGLKKYR